MLSKSLLITDSMITNTHPYTKDLTFSSYWFLPRTFQKSVEFKSNYTLVSKIHQLIKKHLPSSIMAVVTFLPVIPWSQAACTFRSSRILPPFWPVFRRYHCNGKYGSVGRMLASFDAAEVSGGRLPAGMEGRRPRLTRTKPGCWTATWIWRKANKQHRCG